MVMKRLDVLEIKLKLDEACREPRMTKGKLFERLVSIVDEYGLESVPISLLRYVRDCKLEVDII